MDVRLKTSERGFTLMEIIVVIIIIGILASLSYSSYSDTVERHRSAEVYPIFAQFKRGYDIAKSERQSDLNNWNPDVGSDSNSAWNHFEMENPNESTQAYFGYDVCQGGCGPETSGGNVIVAIRRIGSPPYNAYETNLDNTRWLSMDLDRGAVNKTQPY